MNILLFVIWIISFSSINITSADDVQCECNMLNLVWLKFGSTRTCSVKSKLNIVKEDTTITSINGQCTPSTPNTDVRFFYVYAKTVYYIPKGLDILFSSLTGMRFEATKLKHVTKENLKPFPQLVMFASVANKVQFIEKDLFMYNVNLEFVSFRSNAITYIDPAVFNVIKAQLTHLYIDGTAIACGLVGAATSKAAISVIDKLQNSACGDINNAPPLYALWLKMQEGGTDSDCESKIAEKEAAKDAECETKLTEKDTTCTAEKDEQQADCDKTIGCLNDPQSPDCPVLRSGFIG